MTRAIVIKRNGAPIVLAAGSALLSSMTAQAKAASALAVAAAAAMVANYNPDPRLKLVGRQRNLPSQWAAVAPLGIPNPSDADSPLGGGSYGSTSGVIRYLIPASDLPFVSGDSVNIRLVFSTTVNSTSISLDFRNNSNTQVYADSFARNIGSHDETRTITWPSGATYLFVNVGAPSGDAKIFGVAMAYAPVPPKFFDAPNLEDHRKVYAEASQRRIVLFGDSIPANTLNILTNPDSYIGTILSEKLDGIVTNCAFGGTTMALRSGANYSAFSMSALATAIKANIWTAQDYYATTADPADPDVNERRLPDFAAALTRLKSVNWSQTYGIIIMQGTNDFAAEEKAMGSDSDTTGATFKGAVNQIIADLLETYPHLRILFVTPTYRDRFAARGAGTGSTSGTTLTVSDFAGAGSITVGDTIYMHGISKRVKVSALGTGTGGNGTYTLDTNVGTIGGTSTASTIAGTTLTIGGTVAGAYARGDRVFGTSVTAQTHIVRQLTGTAGGAGTYEVSHSQTVSSTAINSRRNVAIADATTNSDIYPNTIPLYLKDYADAIVSRARANKLRVLDLHYESGLNYQTAPLRTADGLHPSSLTGLYDLANIIAQRGAPLLV